MNGTPGLKPNFFFLSTMKAAVPAVMPRLWFVARLGGSVARRGSQEEGGERKGGDGGAVCGVKSRAKLGAGL